MFAKRRKVEAECRNFNDEWTEKYFFTLYYSKPTCLICNKCIAVNKECNIRRHSEFSKYSGQTRKGKPTELNFVWTNRVVCVFQKRNTERENNTQANYKAAKLIAKNTKPFTDGDFIKYCLMAVVETICPEKKIVFQCQPFCKNRHPKNRKNFKNSQRFKRYYRRS